MTLYRPVGQAEYDLIIGTGRFPPRLEIQPIFYPVLTQAYAEKIAREWNTRDKASGNIGYVLKFDVKREVVDRYPVQTVGGKDYQELWVPAEELDGFNDAIVGAVELVKVYRGEPLN